MSTLTPEGNYLFAQAAMELPLELHLFASQPNEAFKEVKGFGYQAAPLEITSTTKTEAGFYAAYKPVRYVFEGPAGLIYGSYAYHAPTKTIVWIDTLDEPFKAVNKGDALTIEPLYRHGG